MRNWNLETLKKKLTEARNLEKAIDAEIKGCVKTGAVIQLKNAQRRSLGNSMTIQKLTDEITRREN